MKRSLALVTTAGLVVAGLSGCATETAENALDCKVPDNSALASYKVTGDKGGSLTITGDFPVEKIEKQTMHVVEKGNGAQIEGDTPAETEGGTATPGPTYKFTITTVDAETGDPLPAFTTSEVQAGLGEAVNLPFLTAVAGCVTDNGRVLTAVQAKDVLDDPTQAGLKADSKMLIAVDFNGKVDAKTQDDSSTAPKPEKDLLEKAQGKAVELPAGFPEVKIADNGEPTITIPEGLEKPTELKVANMVEGEGDTIKEGDRVWVHYRGVMWSTGEEFDSSWKRGAPIDFTTDGVIQGFSKALVGQKVGSRVVSLVTVDAGYPADQLVQMGGQKDDVMVFVLDILGKKSS